MVLFTLSRFPSAILSTINFVCHMAIKRFMQNKIHSCGIYKCRLVVFLVACTQCTLILLLFLLDSSGARVKVRCDHMRSGSSHIFDCCYCAVAYSHSHSHTHTVTNLYMCFFALPRLPKPSVNAYNICAMYTSNAESFD